jgi:hypothetical protein
MHKQLKDLPEVVNRVFDILELIVLRLALLELAVLGAFALLRRV